MRLKSEKLHFYKQKVVFRDITVALMNYPGYILRDFLCQWAAKVPLVHFFTARGHDLAFSHRLSKVKNGFTKMLYEKFSF